MALTWICVVGWTAPVTRYFTLSEVTPLLPSSWILASEDGDWIAGSDIAPAPAMRFGRLLTLGVAGTACFSSPAAASWTSAPGSAACAGAAGAGGAASGWTWTNGTASGCSTGAHAGVTEPAGGALGLLEAAGGAGTAADFFELMIPRVYRKWLQGKTGTRAKKFQGGGLKKLFV